MSYEHHQMQIQMMQLIHERESMALQQKRILEASRITKASV